MKVLLTGKPGVGKSTIIEKVAGNFPRRVAGIVGREVRDASGKRVGFEANDFEGNRKLLSHVSLIDSQYVIGNKYFVDRTVIDEFIVPELQKNNENKLVIVDEIGRMQSVSNTFLKTVVNLLNKKINFLGTIVLDPEPWSLQFKEHPEVVLIEVTENNRDDLPQLLTSIFMHADLIDSLNSSQQALVRELVSQYFRENKAIQIEKLIQNAIPYVLDSRVTQESKPNSSFQEFKVRGNNHEHVVKISDLKWFNCDCDLFHGEGIYENKMGECSHIQAVKLRRLNT